MKNKDIEITGKFTHYCYEDGSFRGTFCDEESGLFFNMYEIVADVIKFIMAGIWADKKFRISGSFMVDFTFSIDSIDTIEERDA